MKQILMSRKPQEMLNILNGKQEIIILKKVPKNFTGWINLYCTKDTNNHLYYSSMITPNCYIAKKKIVLKAHNYLNGLVVARFWLDEPEKLRYVEFNDGYFYYSLEKTIEGDYGLERMTCLTTEEIYNYLGFRNGSALLIKHLEIFDEPKELGEFKRINPDVKNIGAFGWAFDDKELPQYIPVKKAPQSFMYVEAR